MSGLRRTVLSDRSGAAAAEMALVVPLLLLLTMGAVELGNYFMSEHVLEKAVRDGAVYAARQPIDDYDCAGGTVGGSVAADTKTLVRTGQLSGGGDRLPLWDDSDTSFTVTAACVTAASGTTLGGIYTANGGQVPVVTVTASLPYRAVLSGFGFSAVGMSLNASQQAVVMGI